MNKEHRGSFDLLVAMLLALIVMAEVGLVLKIRQAAEETPRVEAIMAEAQARIDAYHASLPARERPVVVSVPPVAADGGAPKLDVPPEPVENWYIPALPLDKPLQKALWDACQEFGLDYTLALAVVEQESGYQNIIGDGGASVGYFQIQPRWWGELMERIGTDDLTDPVDNFRTGCAVLAQMLEQYDGSVTDALTAYNSGHPGESAYADAVMDAAENWRER